MMEQLTWRQGHRCRYGEWRFVAPVSREKRSFAKTGSGQTDKARQRKKTEAFLQHSPLAAIEMTSKAAEAVLPGQLAAAVPSVVLALLFVSFAGAQTQNSHRDLDRNSRVLPRQAQDKL
eukprot:COSAG06_NODE_3848_length_4835_cov_2.255490_4_plen_119_part_00